jgi:flagellar biosynthesis protein FlhF
MRLKSFYAKTMTEAMQMVRETLGEEAIIVPTREEKGGKAVRVTAAVEPAFELNRHGAAPAEDWLQYDAEEEEFAVAEELTEVMLRHGVPEDVMDQILSCATVVGLENPAIALVASIEHLFHFRPLPQKAHKKPVIMVGPPGSGKTLAVAKMAARAAMNGLKTAVITTDAVRAGGVEQLSAFTKLLQINLKKAASPQDLSSILKDVRGYDQVLIDSPGINPFNSEDIRTLAKLIGADDIEPYLVLPAGIDAEESGEMARAFAALGVHTLIPTRIDIARRLGGILSAAHHGSFAFGDASNTARVADGLLSLTPQSLAKLLMPGTDSQSKSRPAHRTGTRQ